MDKNTLIKWALIAGAAYLVYRYAVAQGWIGGTAAIVAPSGGGVQPDTGAAPVVVSPPTTVTAAQIAASLQAIPGFMYWGPDPNSVTPGANTQDGYHWNFFWKLASLYNGRDAGPAEVAASDNEQMTLADYSQRVYNLFFAPTGVSGLSLMRLPSPAFASAWKM
jgi:hypothetical protein